MDFKIVEINEERLRLIVQFRELIELEKSYQTPHTGRIEMLLQLKECVKRDFIKEYNQLN